MDATSEWPPGCCVAAFVAAALMQLGHRVIDRAFLARKLGTSVGPKEANPWQLIVEPDPLLRGVLASDARRRVPPLLREFDEQLSFRHVPFRMVTLSLYQELLEEAVSKACVVGIGFNYSLLRGQLDRHSHVTRIIPTPDPRHVLLLDDSTGAVTRTNVNWRNLEDAVNSIDDGFWIVGDEQMIGLLEYARAAT